MIDRNRHRELQEPPARRPEALSADLLVGANGSGKSNLLDTLRVL